MSKVLLATPIYEGGWVYLSAYFQGVYRELQWHPEIEMLFVVNNSTQAFVDKLKEYCKEYKFPLKYIIDLGKFEDTDQAITQSQNKIIDYARKGNYDYLYWIEQDNLVESLDPRSKTHESPLSRMLEHFDDENDAKRVGIVGGLYHYKKLGEKVKEKMKTYEETGFSALGPDLGRLLVMARANMQNPRTAKQIKEKSQFIDVDGLPFGCTVWCKEVFENYNIPDPADWGEFGTGDFAVCEKIKEKYLIRLLRHVRVYHLYFDEKEQGIKVF